MIITATCFCWTLHIDAIASPLSLLSTRRSPSNEIDVPIAFFEIARTFKRCVDSIGSVIPAIEPYLHLYSSDKYNQDHVTPKLHMTSQSLTLRKWQVSHTWWTSGTRFKAILIVKSKPRPELLNMLTNLFITFQSSEYLCICLKRWLVCVEGA